MMLEPAFCFVQVSNATSFLWSQLTGMMSQAKQAETARGNGSQTLNRRMRIPVFRGVSEQTNASWLSWWSWIYHDYHTYHDWWLLWILPHEVRICHSSWMFDSCLVQPLFCGLYVDGMTWACDFPALIKLMWEDKFFWHLSCCSVSKWFIMA